MSETVYLSAYARRKKNLEYIREFKEKIAPEVINQAASEVAGKYEGERLAIARRHLEIAFMAIWSIDDLDQEIIEDMLFTFAAVPHDTSLDNLIKENA